MYYTKLLIERIGHGDVFKDVAYKYSSEEIVYDFCVVLSQDCDLEQDVTAIRKLQEYKDGIFVPKENSQIPNNDKFINSVLLCPAFLIDSLREGSHLASLNWTMQGFSDKLWSRSSIKTNDNPRYHYLKGGETLPDLVIDFKRFFTIPRSEAYSMLSKRSTRLDTLFRESASQRFAAYLSRIALPEPTRDCEDSDTSG